MSLFDLNEEFNAPAAPAQASPFASPASMMKMTPSVDLEAQFPAYRDWQQKHRAELEQKRRDAEQRQAAASAKAKEQAQAMAAERAKQIEKNRQQNIENEKASIFQRDETLTTGDDWVRVAALCDLTAASNGEKDTARLREILLRLKH